MGLGSDFVFASATSSISGLDAFFSLNCVLLVVLLIILMGYWGEERREEKRREEKGMEEKRKSLALFGLEEK